MSRLRLDTAILDGDDMALGFIEICGSVGTRTALSSETPKDIAVVPQTGIVLPALLILITRNGLFMLWLLGSPPRMLFLIPFALPSLLPELASGTLVSALRIPNLLCCCRTEIISVLFTAVISPTGGRWEPYSSARLSRFFAHISAMPSMAD